MDIDDELQLLQRELMAVQQQKTNPLSQRTVAQIMVKLYHEGFSFIATTDGTQYVTPAKLQMEIGQMVKERGKISIGILPQLLNVGQQLIENKLNVIMQKYPITRHSQNLFSHKYFETILQALSQRLEEEGRIDLEEIAAEHQIKMEFTVKFISENLKKIGAELHGKQLITKEYTVLEKSKVLGFLAAINNPLLIDTLAKTVQTDPKTIQKLIQQLLDQHKIKGKLTHGYYIPQRFTSNQKKIINQFLQNNGYLDTQMLKKKFLITRPEEWISSNFNADQFQKIQNIYIKKEKLESYASQINSALKAEGFLELSTVLPIDLEQTSLSEFLQGRCGLQDYFLCQGYCYSNEWLQKLANEFKHKIVYSIFFKKSDNKSSKDAKKKGKKQKSQPLLTQQELQEVLFNGGYADYTASETLASQLLELMTSRLQELKKKTQKQLTHSKGLITTSFLKYRSCKTILRAQQSLSRTLNIIQKQLKKTQKYTDSDFGPNPQDPNGLYSVIYYDNVLPKGWPALDGLKWRQVSCSELLKGEPEKDKKKREYPMRKCLFGELMKLIQLHNGLPRFKIPQPQLHPLTQESSVPLVFRFFLAPKQPRYVIIPDPLLPFLDLQSSLPLSPLSPYSFAQKAYAKLRYCYKGILSVGLQQMMLQMTGMNMIRYNGEVGFDQKVMNELMEKMREHLIEGHFVLVMGEGEVDKNMVVEDKESQLIALTPYYLFGKEEELRLYPSDTVLSLKQVVEVFKNIFVLAPP